MANKYEDPRWQRKRLEIMDRDGFSCVACSDKSSTLNVHHKRYRGELWESPSDELQTLCDGCHSALGPHPKGGLWYEHYTANDGIGDRLRVVISHCPKCAGRSFVRQQFRYRCTSCGWMSTTPRCADKCFVSQDAKWVDAVPVFWGREVRSFYLAGKITGSPWRDEIVPGWADSQHDNGRQYVTCSSDEWEHSDVCVEPFSGHTMRFTGPLWADQSSGHCGFNFSTSRPHSCGNTGEKNARFNIHRNVVQAINASDMIFSWVENFDCFGTLWELGVAAGSGIPTVVAIKSGSRQSIDELWLAFQGAQVVIEADSAAQAWNCFWCQIAKGYHAEQIEDHLPIKWQSHAIDQDAQELDRLISERRKIMGIS